jgi:hypothetical protein
MTKYLVRSTSVFALFAVIAVLASGCGKATQTTDETKGTEKEKVVAQNTGDKPRDGYVDPKDDHSGWWCPEHGLPEHVCDLCSRKFREAELVRAQPREDELLQVQPGAQGEVRGRVQSEVPERSASDRG